MVEGVVELVALAGLVGEAFLEAGFEFIAPAGELMLVFLEAGRGAGRIGDRRRSGGGSARGGGGSGHASGERSRVMGCVFRSASVEAEKYFFARPAMRQPTFGSDYRAGEVACPPRRFYL